MGTRGISCFRRKEATSIPAPPQKDDQYYLFQPFPPSKGFLFPSALGKEYQPLCHKASSPYPFGDGLTSVGVSSMTSSLSLTSFLELLKSSPRIGISESKGVFTVVLTSSFCLKPPNNTVCPSLTQTVAVAFRVESCGNPSGVRPITLETSGLISNNFWTYL